MYDDQLRRHEINKAMGEDEDYTEKIQNLLTCLGIEIFVPNLMNQSLMLHKTVKGRGSCTCYTKIISYDINPDAPSITFSVVGELFGATFDMITYNFDDGLWMCHGKSTTYLKPKELKFTTRISKQHRKLFASFDLADQSLLNHQISIIDKVRGREITTSIACLTVTNAVRKKTNLKITPAPCYRQMNRIAFLEIWEGQKMWSILPGSDVAQLFLS